MDRGLGHENKYFVRYHLYYFFIKNYYGQVKLMTCSSYAFREQMLYKKKITICKKDDRSSHQNNINFPHFYCKQRRRLILRHLILKKKLRFLTEYIPDVRTILSSM